MKSKKEDLTGQQIHCFTVIALDSIGYAGSLKWLCHCICGNELVIQHRDLRGGRKRHCGCKSVDPKIPQAGERYAMLTVVGLNAELSEASGKKIYDLICECGNTTILERSVLVREVTKSCGCLLQASRRTHGLSKIPEYFIWTGMKSRCLNPNDAAYRFYGGRGISICERWRDSFIDFYLDVGPRPYPEYSLDRIDSDGDYCPENVKWASTTEQWENRRKRGITFASLQSKIRELPKRSHKPIDINNVADDEFVEYAAFMLDSLSRECDRRGIAFEKVAMKSIKKKKEFIDVE